MATFSLGSAAAVPGAPGVYINESAGKASSASVSDFSTVYMLVETSQSVSTTVFPFNRPVPITSLNDYKALIGGTVPSLRIPLLSYNCVNEFFQNAQVGDLRVVRVGSPNSVIEIDIFPTGTKTNSTGVPSVLMAGDKVYVQLLVNGIPLVAGDGATGYTSDEEWLGVPVIVPVNYVAGDVTNNRLISKAFATAIAVAIESNPSVRSSAYVRSFGLVNDLDPTANSENAYISLAGATFDSQVVVVPQVTPVGANYVLMQNGYSISNIVGLQNELVRVPQDYIQCIGTAFDGQQDQGYLVTPTAYAQFDAEGRASVGAAAASLCSSNAYKWMALADAGPYLVTDINKYSAYSPFEAAADLVNGLNYLVDNAIYEWTGVDITRARATYQPMQYGVSPVTAVTESVNSIAADAEIGLLDSGTYTGVSATSLANIGKFTLDSTNYWPVSLQIQEVVIGGASSTSNDLNAYNGDTLYLIAPPFDTVNSGSYSQNVVYLASTITDANSILSAVTLAGGSTYLAAAPTGAITIAAPTGSTFTVGYGAPFWNLEDQININGQSSNLIQNITGTAQYFNTLHLPGTLQSETSTFSLGFTSRTIYDPSVTTTTYSFTYNSVTTNCAKLNLVSHGLTNGQKLYFTQAVTAGSDTLFKATTAIVVNPYYVKVIDANNILLADSFTQYSSNSFILFPSAPISGNVVIAYTELLGGSLNTINLYEIEALPVIRGRKYAFFSGTIADEAADSTVAPATSASAPTVSIFYNTSATSLGINLVSPYGEDTQAGWAPSLNLVNPGTTTTVTENYYCVPTSDQYAAGQSFLVPSFDPILGGSYNPTGTSTLGPIATLGAITGGSGYTSGTYTGVPLTGGTGQGATADITVTAGIVTAVTLQATGYGYTVADSLSASTYYLGAGTLFAIPVATVTVGAGNGLLSATTTYSQAAGLANGDGRADMQGLIRNITGVYFNVSGPGFAPDGTTAVVSGDRIVATYNGSTSSWKVIAATSLGGDLTSGGTPCYSSQVKMSFLDEEAPAAALWNYDAITSTEIFDAALRGVGNGGDATAVLIEAGVDNVNRLLDDSQRYFNPQGFIAFYGPWVLNASGQFIPPSPYVTGVAVRRYRSEGYQFPPAGVKYQLADAIGAQISVNSAQQNLLNPKGCNVIRVLPGYPQTAVFIWGGRTRVNSADSEQRLYQFVNTRVILNIVYGSLRSAFDSQIFNVIDGFGIVYNQIVMIGNSILNQLYVKGALFGRNPSDAFQVICDNRINSAETLENGIVYAQVFVVPVPTLERIQIDLVRVAIGNMQKELDIRGLGQ